LTGAPIAKSRKSRASVDGIEYSDIASPILISNNRMSAISNFGNPKRECIGET
jgi:hypothetical protein